MARAELMEPEAIEARPDPSGTLARPSRRHPWIPTVLSIGATLVVVLIGTNIAVIGEEEHGLPSPVLPIAATMLGLAMLHHRNEAGPARSRELAAHARLLVLGLVLMLFYALALGLSSIGAVDSGAALTAARSWVAGAIIVAALVSATTVTGMQTVLRAVVIATLIVSIPTVVQRLTGTWDMRWLGLADATNAFIPSGRRWRSEGPIESNAFGAWLVMYLPLVVVVARLEDGWRRWAAMLAGAAAVAAILSTYSRGALIGLIVVGSIALVKSVRSPSVLLSGAAVVALLVTAFVPSVWSDQTQNLREVGQVVTGSVDGSSSTAGHVSTSLVGVLMFRDHPVNGVGARNFGEHYLDYADAVGVDTTGNARSAHNSYIQVAAETGVVGILAVAAMMSVAVAGFRRIRAASIRRREQLVADAVALSMVGFAVTSVFRSTSHPQAFWILVAVGIAVAAASSRLAPAGGVRAR